MRRSRLAYRISHLGLALILLAVPAATAADSQPTVLPYDRAVAELCRSLAALREGKVVRVQGRDLYVALGQEDGIFPGMDLVLVRPGETLKDETGRELGRTEDEVGRLRVESVTGPKLCRARSQGGEAADARAGDLARELIPKRRMVAITAFSADAGFPSVPAKVQAALQERLGKIGFQVLEREALAQVMQELKLGQTGLVDEATAARIGKAAGAQFVVVGRVLDAGFAVRIAARLVETETATQLRSASADVPKTDPMVAALSPDAPDPGVGGVVAAGGYRSAVSTDLGRDLNLDAVRVAARHQYEAVHLTERQVAWRLGSGTDCFLSARGFLAVASRQPLDGMAQYQQLSTDLLAALNLIAGTLPAVTPEQLLGKRFLQSRFYADQPGVLHRLHLETYQKAQFEWILRVPDCQVRAVQVAAWSRTKDDWHPGFALGIRGQSILVQEDAPREGGAAVRTKGGTLYEINVPRELLTYGEHAVTCISPSEWDVAGGFLEMIILTGPTEKRFALGGNGADQVRLWVNRPIAELFPPSPPAQ